ncbi:Rho guanine nucleotide exchange factor 26 [Goodea atripinnis]|uniref:Rho guanine nucleotide exchange factor 26 n=1 Tax=Goodea atripinnis TaxID=208336 RepID=A0ABV0PF78_9TELE
MVIFDIPDRTEACRYANMLMTVPRGYYVDLNPVCSLNPNFSSHQVSSLLLFFLFKAIFEVISSEHSYLHSLEILIRMFKNSTELSEAMTKTEHHHLFSNISDVCEASKKFFKELEERHNQSLVIDDISDIVCSHAESNFDPYITYCSNEVYQQRTLQRLM